jgi:hypothetical protein
MARNTEADKRRAAYMKDNKIVRTTGRCAHCYKIITIDSSKPSKYTHKCG